MAGLTDADYIRLAFEYAEKGRGKTSPNPVVGSVIVKKGKIVGTGYHRALGADHAEVAAIRKAGPATRGATLYVSLEPCCHTGRTGPCTRAIIKAGIKRVVLPIKDPNPLVNGKGILMLRKAGIEVKTGLLKSEARRLNDAYFGYLENGRPYVILKLAQSLDGRIATLSGNSQWITSAASRKFAHRLRAEVDAVVVGAGTVRNDNPQLTVRHIKGRNPYRVILSESLDIPQKAALLSDNQDTRTIIASTETAIRKFSRTKRKQNLIYWSIRRSGKGSLDLGDFIAKAGDFGLRSLLVEGGAALATSFMNAKLVDKLCAITAPVIIGDGVESFGDLGVSEISGAVRLEDVTEVKSGPDRIVSGYPVWSRS